MSHIIRFSISDLAGRAEIYERELNRDLNIFFGLNGTGKSSLLKILHSALSGQTDILKQVPFSSAEVTLYSLKYEQEFILSIAKRPKKKSKSSHHKNYDLEDAEISPRLESSSSQTNAFRWIYKTPLPKGANGAWQDTYLPTWRLQPHPRNFLDYNISHRGADQEYDWDFFFADNLERLWTTYSTGVLNALQKIQSEGLVGILRSIMKPEDNISRRSKFNADLAYNRVREFLSRQGATGVLETKGRFEERYREDAQLRRVVDNINIIEQKVEEAKSANNGLQELISQMFGGTKKILFEGTKIKVLDKTGGPIPLASLSSGEKQAMLIFIDALLADESSLIIDEPEISLHIDWQRRLVSDMRLLNPSAQIILATHSPEIMADIPDDKIFSL